MRILIRLCRILFPVVALGMFVFPTTARALPIPGAPIYVLSPGEVIATFLGSAAAFTTDLYLDSQPNDLGSIFTNQTTLPGTTVNLGSFSAGTELVFSLGVQNTGFIFFTGLGVHNPDGVPHAVVDSQFAPNTTYVGFEDIFGGGDQDYNDLTFSLTNTTSTLPLHAPEPASLLLLGSGLAALIGLKKLFSLK